MSTSHKIIIFDFILFFFRFLKLIPSQSFVSPTSDRTSWLTRITRHVENILDFRFYSWYCLLNGSDKIRGKTNNKKYYSIYVWNVFSMQTTNASNFSLESNFNRSYGTDDCNIAVCVEFSKLIYNWHLIITQHLLPQRSYVSSCWFEQSSIDSWQELFFCFVLCQTEIDIYNNKSGMNII